MVDRATGAATYRVAEIIVRGGDLIGFSVMKPQPGGEEAAFLVSRYGSSVIAKRFAQNLCEQLNGEDAWESQVA